MGTHTAVVGPDGTVQVPVDEARPGETVIVRIERTAPPTGADRCQPTPTDEDEDLTVLTADTPEKKERFRQQIHEWGQRNRAAMSEEELNFDWDAWMYDENGLPH